MKACDLLPLLQEYPECEVIVACPYDPIGRVESVEYNPSIDCIVVTIS